MLEALATSSSADKESLYDVFSEMPSDLPSMASSTRVDQLPGPASFLQEKKSNPLFTRGRRIASGVGGLMKAGVAALKDPLTLPPLGRRIALGVRGLMNTGVAALKRHVLRLLSFHGSMFLSSILAAHGIQGLLATMIWLLFNSFLVVAGGFAVFEALAGLCHIMFALLGSDDGIELTHLEAFIFAKKPAQK